MKKYKTMTIKEFMNKDKKEYKDISKYLNNKKIRNTIIVGLAIGLTLSSKIVFAANGDVDLTGIDELGNTFLYIIQIGGYWLCLIMGLIGVLKELAKGGDNFGDIGKVILKYILAFASMYLLPYFFDIAKSCFN